MPFLIFVEQVTKDPVQQAQLLHDLATQSLESLSNVGTTLVPSKTFSGMSQVIESILHFSVTLKKKSAGTWSKRDAQAAKAVAEATFSQASRVPPR
jgi:hypothetical protein